MRITSFLFLCLFLTLSTGLTKKAQAEYTEISTHSAKSAIIEFNDKKQELINDTQFFYKAVNFYHHNIDDRAVFNLVVNDPRTNIPQQKLSLNKVEFLQGFLQEGQRLSSYQQDYNITQLQSYGPEGLYMAQETITEQAIIPPSSIQQKKSLSFSAATRCTSYYQVKASQAVQLGSDCETTIAFPKEI